MAAASESGYLVKMKFGVCGFSGEPCIFNQIQEKGMRYDKKEIPSVCQNAKVQRTESGCMELKCKHILYPHSGFAAICANCGKETAFVGFSDFFCKNCGNTLLLDLGQNFSLDDGDLVTLVNGDIYRYFAETLVCVSDKKKSAIPLSDYKSNKNPYGEVQYLCGVYEREITKVSRPLSYSAFIDHDIKNGFSVIYENTPQIPKENKKDEDELF